jgi:hypothetical protein
MDILLKDVNRKIREEKRMQSEAQFGGFSSQKRQ